MKILTTIKDLGRYIQLSAPKKFLGCYTEREFKVLQKPQRRDDGWEYEVEGITNVYYILWIKVYKGKFKLPKSI